MALFAKEFIKTKSCGEKLLRKSKQTSFGETYQTYTIITSALSKVIRWYTKERKSTLHIQGELYLFLVENHFIV